MLPVPSSSTAVSIKLAAKRRVNSRNVTPVPEKKEADYAVSAETTNSTPTEEMSVKFGDLIVVSNRLPMTITRKDDGTHEYKKSSGGLVTALTGMEGREFKWIGWTGMECEQKEERDKLRKELLEEHKCYPVFLKDEDADMYYNGFSNGVLWPLFHYLYEKNTTFNTEQWEAYKKVNQQFCDAIMEVYKEGDMIWVHDYHLMLLPQMLRKARPDAFISFFLHIPFPSSEIYRILPVREALLEGLLASNVVGFHTFDFARHFLSSVTRSLGLDTTPRGCLHNGIFSHVHVFPIGINPEQFSKGFLTDTCKSRYAYFKDKYKGKKLIVGVDRLDYTKGMELKLIAFEKFLATYPQYRNNVVLIQVGVPTRQDVDEYKSLISHVNEHVGRINSTYGTLDGFPIHYINKSVNFDDLCALYGMADALIVTSIRDGMNLVSSEFVVVQNERCVQENVNIEDGYISDKDSPSTPNTTTHSPSVQRTTSDSNLIIGKPPGVLILSEFAGAARSLGGSLIINPFNIIATAKSIFDALEMPPKERIARHGQNYDVVRTNTATKWGADFMHEFEVACQYQADPYLFHKLSATTIPRLVFKNTPLQSCYARSQKRLFCFDYDGTLINLQKYPALALPTQRLVNTLVNLTSDPKNFVYIITGRDKKMMNNYLGKLPRLGIAAEHGMYCKHPGQKEWSSLYKHEDINLEWMKDVEPILQHVESRTPGSFVELKESSLVFHYRNADPDYGVWQANELKLHLEMAFNSRPMEIIRGKKVIEIRPVNVNKGMAAKKLVENTPDFDFVFCAGDDATDEQMFEELEKFSMNMFTSSSPVRRRSIDMSPMRKAIPPKDVFTCTINNQNAQFSKARFAMNTPDELLDCMDDMTKWSRENPDKEEQE